MEMKKITSFTIDHIRLAPGLYVSRKDIAGDAVITTFDIRMTSPNDEPVMNTAEVHTIEHLGATFLRNHETLPMARWLASRYLREVLTDIRDEQLNYPG